MSSEGLGSGGGRDAAAEAAPRSPADGDDALEPTSTATAAASSSPVRSTAHPNVRYADFRCPICLDLLYKPCAPAAEHCSHAFCFWCIHAAMSPVADSRCPLDRGRFSHQPAVAVVLHKALARLFPGEYRRRARETREEEEASRTRSQAVEEEEQEAEGEGEEGDDKRPPSSSPSSLPPTPRAPAPLSPLDFACSRPGCGRLLLDPVVLNCGHAVCSPSCVPGGRACPACGGAGRVGGSPPRPCALLAALIEALFPEQVAARREEEARRRATAAAEEGEQQQRRRRERQAPPPLAPSDPASPRPPPLSQETPLPPLRAPSLDTHFGIGCDACGAYPIRGRRFRCLDCAESTAVGFDLCGDCFSDLQQGEEGEERGEGAAAGPRAVNIDGRFAQGHLASHRVVEVPLRRSFLHRIADAHPELSMEQVLRLTQLALGRDDDDDEEGGGGEEGEEGEENDAAGDGDSGEEQGSEGTESAEGADEEEGAAARARRAARREGRAAAAAAAARTGASGRAVARSNSRPTAPGPITTRTTTTTSPSGPTATMELEFDPARLPEGFPFATVPELEDFFNFVERVGPSNLPEEARETMRRWFPDLLTFLETHTREAAEEVERR